MWDFVNYLIALKHDYIISDHNKWLSLYMLAVHFAPTHCHLPLSDMNHWAQNIFCAIYWTITFLKFLSLLFCLQASLWVCKKAVVLYFSEIGVSDLSQGCNLSNWISWRGKFKSRQESDATVFDNYFKYQCYLMN